PITRTMGSAPASRHAWTTQRTIGCPATLCTTLGRSLFMRLPLPAARMIAASGRWDRAAGGVGVELEEVLLTCTASLVEAESCGAPAQWQAANNWPAKI